MISVSFPVKPHIKKYLEKKFGEKFIFSHRSSLAPIIVNVLQKSEYRTIKPKTGVVFYDVILTDRYLYNYGVNINHSKLHCFAIDVENIFRDDLFSKMVFNKTFYDKKYRDTMRDFLDYYDISETEIKIETILKDFGRKKELIES